MIQSVFRRVQLEEMMSVTRTMFAAVLSLPSQPGKSPTFIAIFNFLIFLIFYFLLLLFLLLSLPSQPGKSPTFIAIFNFLIF